MMTEIDYLCIYGDIKRSEVARHIKDKAFFSVAKIAHSGALNALEKLGNLVSHLHKKPPFVFQLNFEVYSHAAKRLLAIEEKYNALADEKYLQDIQDQIEYETSHLPTEEDDEEEEPYYDNWEQV